MRDLDTAPNPIDVHVGSRVRLRRKFQGQSQSDLAEALDLTFQQVQKYERGTNRISSSKLYEIGLFLKVSVVYFFEGYDAGSLAPQSFDTTDIVSSFLRTAEGVQLSEAFPRISNPGQRRKVIELVQSLANDGI